uniref:MOSC_N domain-containing protein n=1 Tax=Macrostomum lignano TaxID=282301 RepID=A0A1I8F7N3_9PLAT
PSWWQRQHGGSGGAAEEAGQSVHAWARPAQLAVNQSAHLDFDGLHQFDQLQDETRRHDFWRLSLDEFLDSRRLKIVRASAPLFNSNKRISVVLALNFPGRLAVVKTGRTILAACLPKAARVTAKELLAVSDRLDTGDAPHPAQPAGRATSGIAEAAPSRPSSASHAILAAAATAGLLMAAGADGAARQQQGIRFDIRAGRAHESSPVWWSLDLRRPLCWLDVEGANVECIIEQMLRSIFRADHESHHSSGSGGGGWRWRLSRKERLAPSTPDSMPKCRTLRKTLFHQRLAKTIKSISVVDSEGLITDNSWLCTMCSLNGVQKRHVAIARLSTPVNLGRSSEGVSFILLVVTPTKEKGTKSDIELGSDVRPPSWLTASSGRSCCWPRPSQSSRRCLQGHAHELGEEQKIYRRKSLRTKDFMSQAFNYESSWPICNGIRADLKAPTFDSHYLPTSL